MALLGTLSRQRAHFGKAQPGRQQGEVAAREQGIALRAHPACAHQVPGTAHVRLACSQHLSTPACIEELVRELLLKGLGPWPRLAFHPLFSSLHYLHWPACRLLLECVVAEVTIKMHYRGRVLSATVGFVRLLLACGCM